MQNNVHREIFLSTFYNYIGTTVGYIISFFTLLYLTKSLTVAQFGHYSLILNTQTFFFLLLALGLPSVILRYASEYLVKHDYRIVRRIIWSSMGIVMLFGILVSAIMSVIAGKYPGAVNRFFLSEYLFLSVILGMLRAQVRMCEAAFFAFLKQGYKIFFDILGALLTLALFICSIRLGFGLLGIVLSIAVVDIFLVVAYLLRIESYTRGRASSSSKSDLSRYFTFGIKEYATKLLSFFWDSKIDGYIVAFYLGASMTGIFYFAVTVTTALVESMPSALMQSMSQSVFTRHYVEHEDQQRLIYLFSLINKLKAFFVFPVFLGFFLVIDRVVTMFFGKYTDSIPIFYILLFFMIFYIFTMPLRSIAAVLEKNEISLWGNVVILYKIPMTIFLTKSYGLAGTAFAVGTSFLLNFAVQRFFTGKILEIGYPWKAFYKISINSLAACIPVLFFKPFANDVPSLIILIFIFVVTYLGISFLNKPFDGRDRQILNRPFKKVVFNF
ncbi:MAG: oligosaccharide flippase family protein [Candidatus Omnitrophica bacterium]|nr:oligosaccharide flippase family protein [Candidatus Omnitrophota bacterium]